MAAHAMRRLSGERYYLACAVAFLIVLASLGGASRADELQQSMVRLAAILVIAAALWPLDFTAFRDARTPVIGLGIAYLLLIVQLIPVPPGLWARMPGHQVYALVAQQTNSLGWRPWSLSPDRTLNALAALLPATAIGLLTLALDFRGRLVVARLIVGIAACSALLGMLQFAAGGTALHLFRITSENSPVGLFANRNHEAVLLACALPLVAALTSIRMRQEDASRRKLVIAGAVTVLLIMGIASSGSRMGLALGLVGLAAAAAIFLVSAPKASMKNVRIASGGMAALAATVPIALLLMRGGAIQRLGSDPVDQTRLAALAPMLRAARAFFPFGAGFGTFEPVYRRFEPDALLSTIYLNQAHNEPAQLAIEGGAPALVLLLIFLVWWGHAALRSVTPRGSATRRALGMAMAAVSLILMSSSLVDYPLRTPLLSGIFAVACVELVRSKHRLEAPVPL